jgi:hypothetical protein
MEEIEDPRAADDDLNEGTYATDLFEFVTPEAECVDED